MKPLPRVVIVGFPNVGKSTLFNRLLGERKALVHSLPGMTRDVVTAEWRTGERALTLVDTGGMFGVREEPLSELVRAKAWEAARSADLVLFVLDGKRDVTPAEEELFIAVRKLGRPVFLVVNKIDTPAEEDRATDFYRLGDAGLFFVSAEHKHNLDPLEEAIAAALPAVRPAEEADRALRVAIVGRINVGKSSLINRILGEERLLVSEVPGTTRDSTDTIVVQDGQRFCLVDTAGIRRFSGARDDREKAGIVRAQANIRAADVICQVLDIQEFPTRQDAHIAQLAAVSGKPLLLALNKWDLAEKDKADPEEVRQHLFRRLGFVSYAPLLLVSARTGQRAVRILETAAEVYRNATKRIETSRLNDFLGEVAETAPPRGRDGGKIKVKYMTQTGVLPPTFFLFSHARTSLSAAYERHFVELLRERFDFRGTPLRVLLRHS
jgi:GTPase